MFELRVLGETDLRAMDDGGRIQSVLAQPKRLALLARLAASGAGDFHRRDTLLGLFWAEVPEERARSALRSALYYLRRSLGSEVIVSRGDDEVAVAPDLLWCDAREFRRAIAEGELERALELYRGDLLPGLHLSGARAFEEWLAAERRDLRKAAAEAAVDLARAAEEAGDPDEGISRARRALSVDPFHERAGRPDSAVAVYERYLENSALRRSILDASELAVSLERLAGLYEATGRRGDAARAYRRLVEIWDDPDPALGARLREARRKAGETSTASR